MNYVVKGGDGRYLGVLVFLVRTLEGEYKYGWSVAHPDNSGRHRSGMCVGLEKARAACLQDATTIGIVNPYLEDWHAY